jgi:predicted O-methyltransferase YrrM
VSRIRTALRSVLRRRGLLPDEERLRIDLEPEFRALHERCAPFTMTSPERMYAVYQAVRHVVRARVPGDIVECGVWRGGSSMLAALALLEAGDDERALYLYDTFAGMSEPGERDVTVSGASARPEWRQAQRGEVNEWCYSPLEEVERNLRSTGIDPARLHFVEGKVEDTIPATAPEQIAVLRLDTDWYESTWHELTHLYPRLSPGGVLIVDDYGHWQGAREAVDRYFGEVAEPILLARTDYTGRIGVRS